MSRAGAAGFRSQLERDVAQALTDLGFEWEYEAWTIDYYMNTYRGYCPNCNHTKTQGGHSYWPDFSIIDKDYVIEVKGYLKETDKAKFLAIQEGGDEVRFIFKYDNKFRRNKTMKYSEWCDAHGLKYTFLSTMDRAFFK